MFKDLVSFVREQYATSSFIPLHAPSFVGREKELVLDTIDSTFVSSVGAYVDQFEQDLAGYTGAQRAVAVVNGTAAIHVALRLAGVREGDIVITQALTFVATCNAISYCGAEPLFLDVDRATLGLSAKSVGVWLAENATVDSDGSCRLKVGGKRIAACMPMHTFGHPVDIDGLLHVCANWCIPLIEDAAESLGSFYKGKHTGTFGLLGAVSFNGNKIITTGGGGAIITNEKLGARAKHLTTTAKIPHAYEFYHDETGYNYRMPNLNAALGCAQLEQLERFIVAKRNLASRYQSFFENTDLQFVTEPPECKSNYWLNAVICNSLEQRNALLEKTNSAGVMTRPIWALMSKLPMYRHCLSDTLANSLWLEERVVNLPSSVCLP